MRAIRLKVILGFLLSIAVGSQAQTSLGTGFTYQGEIRWDGNSIDGDVHLRFSLWDAAGSGQPPVGGNQIGASQLLSNVPVNNGLFTVVLNASGEFGPSPFTGEGRWLQIESCGDPNCQSLTILSPRQPITGAPYALNAVSAPWSGLSGIPAGFVDNVDNIGEIIWEASGTNIYRATGNVGIGTPTPEVKLHLLGDESRLRIESTSSEKNALTEYLTDTKRWSTGVGGSAVDTLLNGKFLILDETPGAAPQSMLVMDHGNVGIGTPMPAGPLHVSRHVEVLPQGGGSVVIGLTESFNLGLDGYSVMARYNGAASSPILNDRGGDVLIGRSGPSRLGVGTLSPLGAVHIHAEPATFGGTLALEGDTHTYMSFFPDGVAAGRGGWIGYGSSFNNNLYIVNGLNNIIVDPGAVGRRLWVMLTTLPATSSGLQSPVCSLAIHV